MIGIYICQLKQEKLIKTYKIVFNDSLKKGFSFRNVNIENKKATSERK